jgi:1-acyl-sn-glycerol-3-phosphate acyltransferase
MSESRQILKSPNNNEQPLWRAWQLLVVPSFYVVFAIGCVLLMGVLPFARLFIPNKVQRIAWLRHLVHRCARNWLAASKVLRVTDFETVAPLPAKTDKNPELVIANHPTLVDAFFILAVIPDLCCVLKADLSHKPIFALLIRNLNYLSNNDPEHLLMEGEARLRNGERLLIFPEGTRTEPGEEVQFRLGAAELALRSGACIVPFIMHYRGDYLSKSKAWYQLPPHKLIFRLSLGPTIKPLVAQIDRNSDYQGARRARRKLHRQLETFYRERLGNQEDLGR